MNEEEKLRKEIEEKIQKLNSIKKVEKIKLLNKENHVRNGEWIRIGWAISDLFEKINEIANKVNILIDKYESKEAKND